MRHFDVKIPCNNRIIFLSNIGKGVIFSLRVIFFSQTPEWPTILTKETISGYSQAAAQEYLAKVESEQNSICGEFANLRIYVRVAGMQLRRFPE